MTYKESIAGLIEKAKANPEWIVSFHYVYQFNLDHETPFQVRFDQGVVEVFEGTPHVAECSLTLSEANFIKLINNDLNTTMAFMMGSLKVDGRMGLALKLHEALKHYQ